MVQLLYPQVLVSQFRGSTTSASYPVPKKAGWYKLKITEYYDVQKI